MLNTLKEHPYMTAGAVLLAGVAFFALMSHGGGADTTGVDTSSVAAATAFNQSQMQIQGAIQAHAIDAQTAVSHDNAAIELSKVQGKYSYDIASLQSTDVLAKINADQQVISLQSSLSAATQQKAIDAGVETTRISQTSAVQNTQILANALVAQSTNQTNAVLGVTQSNNAAAIQMKEASCGFLGAIFGC